MILFLKPGSTLLWDGVEVGYTRDGIIFEFSIETEKLKNQRLKVPHRVVLKDYSVVCRTKILTTDSENLKDILLTDNSGNFPDFDYYVAYPLEARGLTIPSNKQLTIYIYKAVLTKLATITLSRREESLYEVEWTAIWDEDNNAIGYFELI
jgi:hypothetical protein